MSAMPALLLSCALSCMLLLSACDGGDGPAPGGVTESEAAALNDAAAMLDADALSPDALNDQAKE